MNSDRFAQIERVCQAALDRPPEGRAAFLDDACAGDADLRAQVDSLLARAVAARSLLDVPAFSTARQTLTAGQRLGPYEVSGIVGTGGMGAVYKARDSRLGRDVAIKVLLPEFAADADRRARFEREANIVAALNHPRICTLHDVGEHEGSIFLVMEYVAGETLAHRLAKGPLPPERALDVAAQIADALAVAHRQGVVHRDLKPANVMLTKAGVKLLDFGLAKLKGEHAAASIAAPSPATTAEGVVVGTLQYMAPEQVEGRSVDARTDVWALGAVLYEMLTGRRPFEGASTASLMAAILEHEPAAVTGLQPLVPPAVDHLVRQCLSKSPDDRPDTAHDVANDLRWMRETSAAALCRDSRHATRSRLRSALGVACIVGAALLGAGAMLWLRPVSVTLARPSLDVRTAEELNAGGIYRRTADTRGGTRTALGWTPDGQALIFVGRRGGEQSLYMRRLDGAEARRLPGTEGAQVPGVSPDGQWVAFWADRAIKKAPLAGGPVMDLSPGVAEPPTGIAWSPDGRLFFGRDDGRIWVIPRQGPAAPVTTIRDGERAHVLPWVVANGRALLYTIRKRVFSWGDEEVVAQDLVSGARTLLLRDAADARYAPSGHLVFLRLGKLFAVPFDAGRLAVRGSPIAVLDEVAQALTGSAYGDASGAGQYAVAATGALAWVSSGIVDFSSKVLVTMDRHGQTSRLPGEERPYAGTERLSPDGRRLVTLVNSLTSRSVCLNDVNRGTVTPLVSDGEAYAAVWSPDGRQIAFGWLHDGKRVLAVQPANGTEPPRIVVTGDFTPAFFTKGGNQLGAVGGSRTNWDIVIVDVDKTPGEVKPLIATSRKEGWAELSPDGRWLAYCSDDGEPGRRLEVYVRSFPGLQAKTQVSIEGGEDPAWNPNGRELFFLTPMESEKRSMMAVDFEAGARAADPPRIGTPRMLFEFANREFMFACEPGRCYDVAPDGQRFHVAQLMRTPPVPPVTHVNIALDWLDGLKAKVPPVR